MRSIPPSIGISEIIDCGDTRIDPLVLRSCAQVFTDAFNGPPWNENWTLTEALAYLQEHYAHGGIFAVQRLGHAIISFACGIAASKSATMSSKLKPLPPHDMFSPTVFYLGEACVPRGYSNRGIGKALVSSLVDAALQRGFTTGFTVTSKDHAPVIKMLRHLQFQLLGPGEVELGGQRNHVYYYAGSL
jgi:ribosomal protein S18 acetylase RimI-like enzyme